MLLQGDEREAALAKLAEYRAVPEKFEDVLPLNSPCLYLLKTTGRMEKWEPANSKNDTLIDDILTDASPTNTKPTDVSLTGGSYALIGPLKKSGEKKNGAAILTGDRQKDAPGKTDESPTQNNSSRQRNR